MGYNFAGGLLHNMIFRQTRIVVFPNMRRFFNSVFPNMRIFLNRLFLIITFAQHLLTCLHGSLFYVVVYFTWLWPIWILQAIKHVGCLALQCNHLQLYLAPSLATTKHVGSAARQLNKLQPHLASCVQSLLQGPA